MKIRETKNIADRSASLCLYAAGELDDLPADLNEMEVYTFTEVGHRIRPLRKVEQHMWLWSGTGGTRPGGIISRVTSG